jgi:ATP diphosphatase
VQPLDRLEALVAILARLRGPQGCPWDHEQDYASLRRYLLEECYEVAEAIDRREPGALREELGDLLFQIVFLSRLAEEDGHFTIADVIRGIGEKLVRRHPHVFGSEQATTAAEVERHWDRIKREEHGAEPQASTLDGIPGALPALLRAQALGQRAARVGFDWQRPEDVLEQVSSELAELRHAVATRDTAGAREELGDLLFTVAMLGRHLQIDSEGALGQANLKFQERFSWIERHLAERGQSIEKAGTEALERLWQLAKRADQPTLNRPRRRKRS